MRNANNKYYFKDPLEEGSKVFQSLMNLIWSLNLNKHAVYSKYEIEDYVCRIDKL